MSRNHVLIHFCNNINNKYKSKANLSIPNWTTFCQSELLIESSSNIYSWFTVGRDSSEIVGMEASLDWWKLFPITAHIDSTQLDLVHNKIVRFSELYTTQSLNGINQIQNVTISTAKMCAWKMNTFCKWMLYISRQYHGPKNIPKSIATVMHRKCNFISSVREMTEKEREEKFVHGRMIISGIHVMACEPIHGRPTVNITLKFSCFSFQSLFSFFIMKFLLIFFKRTLAKIMKSNIET